MSFDQNDNRPLVVWRKWTTKTNLGMIVGVVIFLVLGVFLILFWSRRSDAADPSPSAVSTGKQRSPLVVFRDHTAGGGEVRAVSFLSRSREPGEGEGRSGAGPSGPSA